VEVLSFEVVTEAFWISFMAKSDTLLRLLTSVLSLLGSFIEKLQTGARIWLATVMSEEEGGTTDNDRQPVHN
jgi:hypothetical protein